MSSSLFRSRRSLLRALEAPGADQFRGRHVWSNKDLDPTPPAQRTWTKWDYSAVWWGSSFNANAWAAAAALVSLGLSFSQAMGVTVVGSLIIAVASVLNARQGALYHIGYPVATRSQMGVWGSYFFVFLRAIVAIVWFGIQSYYTGRLFSVTLHCIFGHRWTDMPAFPASAGITSYDFAAFMIVYVLQLPLMFVHPSAMRRLFEVKALLIPPAALALTVWACKRAGGFGAFDLATATTVRGADFSWAWISGINTVISSTAPMIVNQPDLARYARRPSEAGWPQGLAMFVVKILVSLASIATTSALKVMYGGPATWNLWDQLSLILAHEWNARTRFLVAVLSALFAFATVLTNVSANSIPFGADSTGVWPRWLTIRRGQVLIWFAGLAIVPWKFLVGAAQFIVFLGSYTILMGAVVGVIFADFFWVRRGNIHVPSLYDGAPGGLYYFYKGVNWRGVVAWACGFFVPFPGLVGSYNAKAVDIASIHMYNLGWMLSVSLSFAVYVLLAYMFPVPVYPASHKDRHVTWEYLGHRSRAGVFEDEVWHGPAAGAGSGSGEESGESSEVKSLGDV